MPKDKPKFVNPLTQSTTTETETEPATQMETATPTHPQAEMNTQPSTETATETPMNTYTSSEYIPRKRGKQAFEKTHQRFSSWLDKRLYKQLDTLAKREEMAKSTLLDEAVTDLLRKYEKHLPE